MGTSLQSSEGHSVFWVSFAAVRGAHIERFGFVCRVTVRIESASCLGCFLGEAANAVPKHPDFGFWGVPVNNVGAYGNDRPSGRIRPATNSMRGDGRQCAVLSERFEQGC